MFDLVDKLSRTETKKTTKSSHCALFYQSQLCNALVQKAFRFEGFEEPISFTNEAKSYDKLEVHPDVEVVFIELNQSSNVAEDAKQLVHSLPTHLSVIIIGNEDAISTIRALKEQGLYYLFWPANEAEVMDFYRNVARNHEQKQGVGRNRKAKQIAFMGVKGGVGTSLVACEVSRSLAKHHNASTLLIDHTYTGSNIDVMLGLKRFNKRSVQKGTLVSGIDSDIALSLVQNIEKHLSILAVESDEFSRQELHQYTQALKKQVIQNNTFIVEDYSHTATTNEEFERAIEGINVLVLVFDATVSSLRELNRISAEIELRYPELKMLTVMNRSRPDNAASINEADVEKYFGRKADAQLVFDFKANQYLLQGELISDTRSEMKRGLQNLVALLVGDKVEPQKGFTLRSLLARKG
ncbi:ATPase [Vibrio aquaticus]|uniref:ATPase n=1 Tax=Vibrio aquaticus TaxID=2496559 RepID=A0A3S0V1R2_9VIBR|nr:ATPase [Vibrio aquaticus]RTZ14459.1 ATPase [Vibrio aquaticus]